MEKGRGGEVDRLIFPRTDREDREILFKIRFKLFTLVEEILFRTSMEKFTTLDNCMKFCRSCEENEGEDEGEDEGVDEGVDEDEEEEGEDVLMLLRG